MKEEQRSYYKELLAQVDKWMSSMERRIESLDPVAMDMQLIESQIESLQVTIYNSYNLLLHVFPPCLDNKINHFPLNCLRAIVLTRLSSLVYFYLFPFFSFPMFKSLS